MYKDCQVKLTQLKKTVNLDRLNFKTTREITPLSTVIGQDRAVSAINFALEIGDSGYNLFVTGRYGTGRTTIVSDLLKQTAKKRKVPNDLAFVYNFDNPDEPLCLEIPSGGANDLRKEMNRLIFNLQNDLQKAFESKTYISKKNDIAEALNTEKQDLYNDLEREALSLNIQIKSSTMGFITIPMINGKAIESTEFQNLPEEKQEEITKNATKIQKLIQDVARKVAVLERNIQDKIDKLNTQAAQYVVDTHFAPMIEKYSCCKDVKKYLNTAADNIINTVYEFLGYNEEQDGKKIPNEFPAKINKFQINVVIDNSKQKGAPVIYETNPTYNNLFGRIEKKAYQGFAYTDYTMIKAGSLLQANGGYLIVDADQLLKQPFSYEALKRALRSRMLRIEDYYELSGYSSSITLKPASVPLDIKVVIIGQTHTYQVLHNYDEEFRKIFKVRADFDTEVKDTPSTIKKYTQFIARVVKEENLLHFSKDGVERIIEYGYRISDHQKRLSIQFGEIVKVIREASFWAAKNSKKLVSGEEVTAAIKKRNGRHDLVEEKIHESILENTINVHVKGMKVGQINGLAVYDLGDYSFGKPSRITANTFIGSRGVINIEREAKLSGRIHDKGLLVLSGYFSEKFGADMPLSFSASITFEQNYGTIDGDSASSTELYALLSSLSGYPINQGIAVTGSVNQKGEVQAIGGVNEKVEGFYQVCKAKGITGTQGVIIPKSNIKNLMLSNEVITAIEKNKFRIWAVDHIEDGIRILTGRTAGIQHKDGSFTKDSVFESVRDRLVGFARKSKNFTKNLTANDKKDSRNDEEES